MNIGICIGFPSVQSLRDTKKQHGIVVKLTEILAKEDKSWQGPADGAMPKEYNNSTGAPMPKINNNTTDGQRDTPLIAAAKNGIPEIVEAILKVFPQAIGHENHKKENVFHVAVQNRRTNVLNLLKSYKFDYSRLIWKFNADGDGILHKAAYKTGISSRERPGEALCLQSDIQWFERVRKMVPAHHANLQNKKECTPQSLFTKEHEKLVKKGQEWLIRTTNSCIIVAVLIATVAFTSIYTVPGGSDAKTGKPLLLNTTAFTVFTASDVASLCFAFTSVVVFLSITTSKMNEKDFRMSLPLKLVLGLSMLFFSVAALMIGFAATLVMTIRHRLHQAAAPIIAIACFPVAFFLFLQLRLYTNITWFTIKDLLRSLIDIIPKKMSASIID
ncbi:putative ankyrin repeat-containing domain, PGG domain-containing protein [Rosa chinensis]|uniref:Putative ankyrin repeat-containing domain, PGG domain-containing protein n=1 Tax=Rosa chinensis TaxID=74649 RepID=A0A2P6Q2C7_ROSCH|nr:putative ankyrin repeat-containing domain, PGG domain-containing protein [Rosa chinensis]